MKRSPALLRLEHWAYRGVRRLLFTLPHGASRPLGRALGTLAYALDTRHRRVARENLSRAFPDLSRTEHRALARGSFRHFGSALCDAVSASRFDSADLCRRATVQGWEHLEEALSRGSGVLLTTGHLGHWEMCAYLFGLYRGPLTVVGRPLDNPLLDGELVATRERFGNVLVSKRGAARRLMAALKAQQVTGILIDQRLPRSQGGIEVPFFGRPALTSPLVARLSLRTGAPVVPTFCWPRTNGRYHLEVQPSIDPPGDRGDDATVAQLTARYMETMEAAIRRHPELWLWLHRRWRLS